MMGLVVDNFAGGGGASEGIEKALGRPGDNAINHSAPAIAMHRVNHPDTLHHCENVWQVKPREVCKGRPVDLGWFSPDCTHFSKAKGGKPDRSQRIRGLAWVVLKWAGQVRPRVIFLENVEEFEGWGPLTRSGRPCPHRKGMTFEQFVSQLRALGYAVEWRNLVASDYGAPTSRKRLFLVARCDGEPIVWPAPTHGPGLLPVRCAADIIDWSIRCPSIFDRKKPLAPATLRRIAKGLQRYVFDAAEPFIVPVTHKGSDRVHGIQEPLRTVTTASRGEFALVTPIISRQFGKSVGSSIEDAVGTVTAGGGGKTALVAAFLAQHNTGVVGHHAHEPVSTLTGRGTQQQLVTAHMLQLKGSDRRDRDAREPTWAITSQGEHIAEVRAFLVKYFGTATAQDLAEPLHTVTSKARFGLVLVHGTVYQIVDIGMRMLTPRELFRAQSFEDDYQIDCLFEGKFLTKTQQIALCGNSVPPVMAEVLVRANAPFAMIERIAA